MRERKYKVLIDNMAIADNMDINTAVILAKALFNEYYNDSTMVVSIQQIDDETVCAE